MEVHPLERGKAIRRKGDREGVTKIDEESSRREKGRRERRWERGWACRGCRRSSAKTASIRGPWKVLREVLALNRRNCRQRGGTSQSHHRDSGF